MKIATVFLCLVLWAGSVMAASPDPRSDIPVSNWSVDTNWRPRAPEGAKGILSAGLVGSPTVFQGFGPCRLVDTRGATGTYGGPSLGTASTRSFVFQGTGGYACTTATPSNVVAYSLNFTVIGPAAGGYMNAWPTGQTQPTTSIVNYATGITLADSAIVLAGTSGSIDVYTSAAANVIIDINGVFLSTLPSTNPLVISSAAPGSGAIEGINSSTTLQSSGVYGVSTQIVPEVFGVVGTTAATFEFSSGVKGVDGSGEPPSLINYYTSGGVIGLSTTAWGVAGFSQATSGGTSVGVRGTLLNSSGSELAVGRNGYQNSGHNYAFYGDGELAVTGVKAFIEPHPLDASKVVRFVCLEGPEAGVYFRGTSRTTNGNSTIEIPEGFQIAADTSDVTVQLTAIGGAANLWVETIDATHLSIRSKPDVGFHYLVQGVRKAFKDFVAVTPGSEFAPESRMSRLPLTLPEELRLRLIANGTYNQDGSVNMETARRLGWQSRWAPTVEPAKE